MASIQYYDVIIRPVVTEKTMDDMADKKYTFFVHKEANRTMVKEAVEKMFDGVKVEYVNTMNLKGKYRRRGQNSGGYTAARKKAIVQLKDDSKEIELFQGL